MNKKRYKKDFEIKIIDAPEISDAFESEGEKEDIEETVNVPVIDILEAEPEEFKIVDKTEGLEELQRILLEFESTTRNKDRANLIDKLIDYLEYEETIYALKDIAINDKYPLCRAKAVSFLSESMMDKKVKELIIGKLRDSSQTVRLWAVWSLRAIVEEEDVQEVLIRQLRHYEKSKKIKLWLVRTLSDKIENPRVIDVFLQSLKGRPDKEMRKLILYYIMQIQGNPDISYFLSTYVHKENDREIRLEIVKKLLEMDNSDSRYALQKLKRKERNQEIISLLS
ncbi:MAG: HEAT repeat domain-containing protein [Candidatus Heimdallarchaeaceae archaeon]